MLHAGLPPQWDIALARRCAAELEAALRGDHSGRLFEAMYGNQPDLWRDDLGGDDRLRFITNALTRLRVCDADGRLLLKFKGPLAAAPAGAIPWFRAPRRRSAGARIVCGHWSALGYLDEGGVLALDTGCVWGGPLTAQRLDLRSAPVTVASTQPAQF
jgi:bis(5'-nucleosyl)-tetraphosphatase (symmetrical)